MESRLQAGSGECSRGQTDSRISRRAAGVDGAGRALAQEETTNRNERKLSLPKPWTSFRAHALIRMIQREGVSLVQPRVRMYLHCASKSRKHASEKGRKRHNVEVIDKDLAGGSLQGRRHPAEGRAPESGPPDALRAHWEVVSLELTGYHSLRLLFVLRMFSIID